MPELPEVEVLVRHLAPLLVGRTIREVEVQRPRVIRPATSRAFAAALTGATFVSLTRRGKFLRFEMRSKKSRALLPLIGHLGMTGRMFVQRATAPLPKHTAVALALGRFRMVYEDVRYFGRLTLSTAGLDRLGPEPLGTEFTADYFAHALARSTQAIKVKLLDQSLVAGVGNIYASEALFRARISPRLAARRLTRPQIIRLRTTVRAVLADAIACGSTIPLDFVGAGARDGLFYFGRAATAPDFYAERLRVYDRAQQPCPRCRTPLRRIVQAARSTFFCPRCQRA